MVDRQQTGQPSRYVGLASHPDKLGLTICSWLGAVRKILGTTRKDHVTNMEVLSRTGQRRLQDIVAEIRLRMAGHIIRMPPGRLTNHAISWTPCGSGRRRGRPTEAWRSTFKEDLVDRGVDWNSVRAVATNRSRCELLLPIVLSRTGGSKC